MQNGTLENGAPEHHINDTPNEAAPSTPPQPSHVDTHKISSVNDQNGVENGDNPSEDNGNDAPPNKKRKLTDPAARKSSEPKQVSPPWKFNDKVEGPSSFVEEGRRKSSRTNLVPIELQPQAGKRQTRAAIQQKSPFSKSKYAGPSTYKSSPLTTTSSTQTKSNVQQRPQSAGKPAVNTASRLPSKTIQPATSSSKSPADSLAPPKRSHKKKIRPPSPSQSRSPSAPNPHQTRRAARSSETTTSSYRDPPPTTNGWHENEEEQQEEEEEVEELVEIGPNHRPQRLSLKVRMPTVNIQHPGHVLPERKCSSFKEWFETEGRLAFEDEEAVPAMSEEEARREARLRNRIFEAAKPGGLLSEDTSQFYRPEPFEAPPRQYTHQDRLVTHAVYFRKLMNQEHDKHTKNAKELAAKAAALVRQKEEETYLAWKQGQPKTEEEIAQEQYEAFREVYQQVGEDIKKKWIMVSELVEAHRIQEWKEEQDRLGKEALNEAIEKSKGLLDRRRTRGASGLGSDEEIDNNGAEASEGPGPGLEEESEDEGNMSSSQAESEEDHAVGDDDEGLTQEELRQKYAAVRSVHVEQPLIPESREQDAMGTDPTRASASPRQVSATQIETALIPPSQRADNYMTPGPPVFLDDGDDDLMDESDESVDMNDDMGDSDETSGEDEGSGEGSGEEPAGLLGFFSKKELRATSEPSSELPNEHAKDLVEAEGGASEEEAEEVSLIPDATQGPTPSATNSEEPNLASREEDIPSPSVISLKIPDDAVGLDPPGDLALQKTYGRQSPTPMNLKSLVQDASLPSTPISTNPLKTAVPSLLRGTLREYQHFGLDWLAGLYANGTNGILADEMGLGKTIQTIALLAHLAVEHEAWGPHLIVVPTSVMLNWEMEFKKFLPGFKVLTYYGTQDERRKKRQGWMDEDKWNVWITSYTLITNDQQVFKRRAWHYMILDEAHNIKNFQSLRWQTLLTFKTRARLLLTGTPLQNNLTELWSLLFFLMPADSSETGIGGFADLQEFTDWFKKPVEQILEHGRETMDDDARAIVAKLHKILRPYLLRRLKADVEKQMPGKYEHVVYCRLSKRQRYLYDGFMSRAQTRETLASGNTFSIMNALMQLRKVCNHPDLFETRQIVTSFAMPKSAVADFEIKELLVRRRLLQEDPMNTVDLNVINLYPGANDQFSPLDTIPRQRLGALGFLRHLASQQRKRVNSDTSFDGTSVQSALAHYEHTARFSRWDQLRHAAYLTSLRSQRRPLYSHTLMEKLRFGVKSLPHPPMPDQKTRLSEWYLRMSPALNEMVLTLPERSKALETTVSKFACVTPSAVATDMAPLTLSRKGVEVVRSARQSYPQDPYHEARMRLSIAFPDKRLLQYDCGKLQKLDSLLRTLQAGGHRALIFTQMTRVLDILEQFLNIHGHRYLRLDGATKVEQRQILTERFNNDNTFLAFILSSRSGGIGINLTGADTVIFYDLDWNPAMDKQCQDRCHRIGQTRDVHIYRMVSEYTIEANILRKANQKRMLDDVVIQEGEFTTDYFNSMNVKDLIGDETLDDRDAEANAAMDRVLGSRSGGKIFEQVEDQEDIAAAKVAEKEMAQTDAADFDEKGGTSSAGAATPKTPRPQTPGEIMPPPAARFHHHSDVEMTTTMEAAESGLMAPGAKLPQGYEEVEELPSCDDYMLRFMEWELRDVHVQPPVDKSKKKSKKGKEHGTRKR
ncbi:swr1 complex component [Mycoblastus sanguinarius]|nr:swr1 complex component [Mycoblastus sanguinarius]